MSHTIENKTKLLARVRGLRGVFPTYPEHPVDRLRQAGVSLSTNTDAPGSTDLTLRTEYQRMHDVFGWDQAQFKAANLDALAVAFIEDSLRQHLGDLLGSS